MKCGSIEEALEMVMIAKNYNLKIMLGCILKLLWELPLLQV